MVIRRERLAESEEIFFVLVCTVMVQVHQPHDFVGQSVETFLPIPLDGGLVDLPVVFLLGVHKKFL